MGTNGDSTGTGGGRGVTSGTAARRGAIAAMLLIAALQGWANGASRLDDLRGAGETVAGWRIAIDEGTSLLAWYLLMVAIWWLVRTARPPRLSAAQTLAVHAGASVLASLAHVGLFVLFRTIAYAVAGESYRFSDDWGASLLYEMRKDVVSYLIVVLVMAAIQHFFRDAQPSPRVRPDTAIEVPDGAVTHRIPLAEIVWAEAAGNYVTLHLAGRSLLHRRTLAALESELGTDFARIHRSRLVRRDAVRRVTTGQSGDFVVMLADGSELRGSRRFRGALREG